MGSEVGLLGCAMRALVCVCVCLFVCERECTSVLLWLWVWDFGLRVCSGFAGWALRTLCRGIVADFSL